MVALGFSCLASCLVCLVAACGPAAVTSPVPATGGAPCGLTLEETTAPTASNAIYVAPAPVTSAASTSAPR